MLHPHSVVCPGDVTTLASEALALVTLTGDGGIQRKSVGVDGEVLRDGIIRLQSGVLQGQGSPAGAGSDSDAQRRRSTFTLVDHHAGRARSS